MYRIETYVDKKKEFRWKLWSPNGRILADSGEGYTRKDNMRRALQKLHEAFTGPVSIEGVITK